MKARGSIFKSKAIRIGVLMVMLATISGLLGIGTASADYGTQSDPAPQFEVKVGYAGGTYTHVRTFQRSDLEALANVEQAYSFIDNMPCPVIDSVGEAVTLTDILTACDIDVNNVVNFKFLTTDMPAGYPYETLTKAYLLDTPRYYFPHLGDDWTTDGNNQIVFPDPTAAAADAVQVPTAIAITDNWQREFTPLQPDFTTQDDSVRFRLVFGKTNDLANANPEHTASKSAKWIYEMDVTLSGT